MKRGQRVKRAGRGEVRRMETISTGEVSLLVREQGGFLDWSRACSEQRPHTRDMPQIMPSLSL